MDGNTLAALISVGCVLLFGTAPWLLLAVAFSRLIPATRPYPQHWL